MGTRSTVKFYDDYDNNSVILSVYQQYDGYIGGVGHDLANWLKDYKIINGFQDEKMSDGYANGMGCLAAQFVASQKTKIGNFYLTTIDDSQEYNYHVKYVDDKFIIKVNDIFEGTPEELLQFKEQ